MEEVIERRKQENQSPTLGKLAEALSKAQALIEGSAMDATNPFFHSKYSTLSSVWEACRKPLTGNGLSVVQTMSNENGRAIIITTLLHSSGEWIRGRLAVKPVKDDPQALGSAITYGRRYSLAAIAGISPEDDDGNEATQGEKGKPPTQQKTQTDNTKSYPATDRQKRLVWAMMNKITDDPEAKKAMVIEARCPDSSDDWTSDDINKLLKYMDIYDKTRKE